MLKLHEELFAAPSVAVHVSTVVPSGNVLPEGGTHPCVARLELSVADEENVATAPPAVHSSVWLAGHVIAGGVWSVTVTFALQVLDRVPSDTVSVTCVVPRGKGPVVFKDRVIGSPLGSELPLSTWAGITLPRHVGPAATTTSWHRATGGPSAEKQSSKPAPKTLSGPAAPWSTAVLKSRLRTVVTVGDPKRSRTKASQPAEWGADADVPKNRHWPWPPGFAAGQVPFPNAPAPLTEVPSDADQVGATVA